ncbi:MAG: hypothetical protein ABMA01_23855, partial [Chthoniobacteraceae bacterium]
MCRTLERKPQREWKIEAGLRGPSGAVVANRWFVDLDDTYFRGGDVLYYAWIVTDNGGGMASLPPGITTPPVS